jgi:signal-transduction protein with cAMP-binding, CBS, and nucleotidyltransferase domain
MKHAGASALMVLHAHTGQPIGIITEKDIAHAVADGKDLEQTRIHDLMTARPTLINPTTSIPDAATLMSRGHFRHLPVSGDTGLIGMLDIADVCRAPIDPGLSQRPTTGNARSLYPPSTARGQISVQNTAICTLASRPASAS